MSRSTTAASSTSAAISAPATAVLPVALGPGPAGVRLHLGRSPSPADNGTWSVTLVAGSGDRALLGLTRPGALGDAWCGRCRPWPTGWTASRSRTASSPSPRSRTATATSGPAACRSPPGSWRWATPGRAPIPRSGGARRSGCCTRRRCATRSAGSGPTTRRALRGVRRRRPRPGRALVPGHAVLRPPPAGRDGGHGRRRRL